jgi:hypothetical protein
MLSGEYVLFPECLSQAQLLYETTAALGTIYLAKLETFTELFSEPGRQADIANFLVTAPVVTDRLTALPDEPNNFYEMYSKPEFMRKAGNFGVTQFSELASSPKLLRKICILKIPVKEAFKRLFDAALEGIQLGIQYPDLVEKFFLYKYDANEWRVAHEAGLEIDPTPPKTIPLSDRQIEAKALIRPYIEQSRPDLLAKLDL